MHQIKIIALAIFFLAGYIFIFNNHSFAISFMTKHSVADGCMAKGVCASSNETGISDGVLAHVDSKCLAKTHCGIGCVGCKPLHLFRRFAYKPNPRKWRFSSDYFSVSVNYIPKNAAPSASGRLTTMLLTDHPINPDYINTTVLLI